MKSEEEQKNGQPKVMLVGFGEEGSKAVLSSLDQFEAPEYAFAVCDVANVLINIEEPRLAGMFYVSPNWEQGIPMALKGLEMVVLLVGLGGHTGGEAAKVFAQEAVKLQIPVVVLATMPFEFEGPQRQAAAAKSLQELKAVVNSVVVIPNELLFSQLAMDTNVRAAFEQADNWLTEVAVNILKPFTYMNLINVRKENLLWLTQKKDSTCAVGIGWGEGENPVAEAIQQLSMSPFLQQRMNEASADAALVMVSVPDDTSIQQLQGYMAAIRNFFPQKMEMEIGACTDESVAEGVRVVALMHFPAGRARAERGSGEETTGHRRNRYDDSRQLMLDIPEYKTGIFGNRNNTMYDFVNLDVPTYLRWKVKI